MSSQYEIEQPLAIHGGEPSKQRPDPPMFPGGMSLDEEEEQAVLEVIRSKRLFRHFGPGDSPSKVAALETAFADFMGTQFAVAVTSGTAALTCGLHAIGVGPDDEVIIPAYTWIASAAAVISAGAIPVIAEVDETLLLDPIAVEANITPYTKAVMPVHMRGAPCRMDEILALANKHELKVIEDTAQADGACYKGQRLGTFGDIGCFSLQFNKIITSGMKVEASDGKVGSLDELVVDPKTGKLTHLQMREGHLWGKKDVAIPVSDVDFADGDTVYLKIDKAAVKALPAVRVKR